MGSVFISGRASKSGAEDRLARRYTESERPGEQGRSMKSQKGGRQSSLTQESQSQIFPEGT